MGDESSAYIEKISDSLKRRKFNKRGLWHEFDDENMSFDDAIELSLASLNTYGKMLDNWQIAYSGGKDSSALLAFVLWAIDNDLVKKPDSLTVVYSDTGMELPPLAITAKKVLERVVDLGYCVNVVEPPLDRRFFVQILGRGLPPPKQHMRWCTRVLKRDPMISVLSDPENTLTLTGVRIGESSARDQRINTSCSSNDGECGQGWFQQQKNALAPLLHWRVCWVWDFLRSESNVLPETLGIVPVYITDDITDIRTGCIGCNIVSRDWALEYLVKSSDYSYLEPLTELRPMYDDMLKKRYRHRRGLYKKSDGSYSESMSNVFGPLTIPARQMFFERVIDIQERAEYTLISPDECRTIREMWEANTMPMGWSGDEYDTFGDKPVIADGQWIATQLALSI